MGTSGLVGPIGVITGWAQMPEGYTTGAFDWVGMILICFVLPLLITWVIGKIFRAKGSSSREISRSISADLHRIQII